MGAAAIVAGGGSLVALSATPAAAHETSIPLGRAVGTVGSNHLSAELCELDSPGHGVGAMNVVAADGRNATLIANEGCVTESFRSSGGIVRYRVGWDQGGGILWSGWKNA
jgi:hypothetical protein